MKLLLGILLLLAVEDSYGSPVSDSQEMSYGSGTNLGHFSSFLTSKLTVGLLSLQYDVDISAINPCKDKDLLSCTPTLIDWNKLEHIILLAGRRRHCQSRILSSFKKGMLRNSDLFGWRRYFIPHPSGWGC